MIVGLLLLATSIGLIAVTRASSKKTNMVQVGYFPTATGLGQLGQLHRLLVRVPAGYVSSVRQTHGDMGQKTLLKDVRARVERLGWTKTLLATQDPTDNSLFTVLARSGPQPNHQDDVIKIISAVPVEEPPEPSKEQATPLDSGLTTEEAITIKQAFLNERNPRHLHGLATTLEPFFPVSASLLHAKADLIENDVLMDPPSSLRLLKKVFQKGVMSPEVTNRGRIFEEYARKSNMPLQILRDEVKRAASKLTDEPHSPLQGVPEEISLLARSLIRDITNVGGKKRADLGNLEKGIWVVSPEALRAGLPPTGEDEGFVSPSALQLALASQKPKWSQIQDEREIKNVYEAIGSSKSRATNPLDVLKAQNQMERAKRAIERRRWIEWYRRYAQVNNAQENHREVR